MGFVLKKFTSAKVNIPDKARKEMWYQYQYEIVSKVSVFRYQKHCSGDQLRSNVISDGSWKKTHKMALKGNKNVTIAVGTDKRTSQPHLQSPYQEISYQCN